MNKTILNIIRLICLIVVGSLFLSYFVITCNGQEYHTTGFDAIFGNEEKKVDSYPQLILVPLVAIIVFIAVTILSKKENNVRKITAITVIGGIVGIILMIIAYNTALNIVRKQFGISDISSYFSTGIGFKICVGAFISMVIFPFVGMVLPKNKIGQPDIEEKTNIDENENSANEE